MTPGKAQQTGKPQTQAVDLDELLEVSRQRVAAGHASGVEAREPLPRPSTKLVQLSVRVPDEVRRQVRDLAHRTDISVQQLVLDALRAHLRRVEQLDAPSAGMVEFARDYWELVRQGGYRRDIDSLDDPDLAVQ
jgi:predicted HicB family RNase H-like nuclease